MKLAFSSTAFLLQLFVSSLAAGGEGFLKHDPNALGPGAVESDQAFKQAMTSAMGCDASRGGKSQQRLAQIQRGLLPMWHVLPKNRQGRVEWKILRYLTHRYFLQQSSLLIRGLEPGRQVNDSQTGFAEILDKHGPLLIGTVLEGKRSSSGFSLEDGVAIIGAMEQLMFDSEGVLLEKAYNLSGQSVRWSLTKQQLLPVLETYMLLWMLGDDSEIIEAVMTIREELEAAIAQWNSIVDMIEGLITGMEFSRQRYPKPGYGKLVMTQAFSFEDAHELVGALSKTFASYWESECQTIKTSLESMDYNSTGRVKLSDFYGANIDGNILFAEKEAYLLENGMLDDSSAVRGTQLVIPNYLHGASNCIVTFEHYFVCCVNECEGVLSEIEGSVASPLAAPEEIVRTLASITTFDDEPPYLTATLQHHLERIAMAHAGKVPIHGRLFAQWLHFVFPRECPFPYTTHSTPAFFPQYPDTYFASEEEVLTHASTRNETTMRAPAVEEAQLMPQWSEEEELLADYSLLVPAPWRQNLHLALVGVFAFLVVGCHIKIKFGSKVNIRMKHALQYHAKSHFV